MKNHNIFRKLLKELPKPKNEVIASDPKDIEIAKQMSLFINFKIVESRDEEYIENSQFKECFISDYKVQNE